MIPLFIMQTVNKNPNRNFSVPQLPLESGHDVISMKCNSRSVSMRAILSDTSPPHFCNHGINGKMITMKKSNVATLLICHYTIDIMTNI